jgi:MOSC domain-containing protein YiiM
VLSSGRLVSVNVGPVAPAPYGAQLLDVSGIDKRPRDGRIPVEHLGLAGDEQADRRHHGGADQAVYAYALEDLGRWAAELDRDLRPGGFGENLTTLGVDVTGAVIGERWRIGTAVLEVSGVRIPCRTFQNYLGVPGWIRRFTARGACGAYLRVVTPGAVAKGDIVDVDGRPAHGVTVGTVFRALTTEPELLPRLLDAPALGAKYRSLAERRLAETPAVR